MQSLFKYIIATTAHAEITCHFMSCIYSYPYVHNIYVVETVGNCWLHKL